MNQNLNQNVNGVQPPQKDNTLKIVLIIVGAIVGIAVVGIVSFFFLVYVIFNKSLETFNEAKEDIFENYNSSSNSDNNDYREEEKEDEESKTEQVKEYSHIEKLNLTSFKELINDKRSFVVVISQTYCSHCIEFKPTLNKVLSDNNVIGYELDILTLNQKEVEELTNMIEVSGTPTTLIYIDGVVQTEKLEGNVTQSEVTTYLKKYGFIK